jgi:hypothetical protein
MQTTSFPPESPSQQIPEYNVAQAQPRSSTTFIWPIVTLVAVLLAGAGGYMFARTQMTNEVAQQIANTSAVPLPSPKASPEAPVVQPTLSPERYEIPADWQKQSMPTVGLSFYIPARVAELGTIQEESMSFANEGSMICGQFVKLVSFHFVPMAYAGGGCSTAENPYMWLTSTSSDFAVGRSLGFSDMQSFKKVKNAYVALFKDSEFPLTSLTVTEVTNQHDVSILKVRGNGVDVDNTGPSIQAALNKNTGIIIKGPSTAYPGLSIVFKQGGLTDAEIDTLIQSVEKM